MKKFLQQHLLTIILMTAVSACTPSGTVGTGTVEPTTPAPSPTPETAVSPTDDHTLVDTQWTLEAFGPALAELPLVEGSNITLEFETAVQVIGSGDCNSYGGDYTVQGDAISFDQIIHTQMACADQSMMKQEQRYFEALQTADSFTQMANRLIILYNDGGSILNFVLATSSRDTFPSQEVTRVIFDTGETSAELEATIAERNTHYYVLRAFEGQELTAEITSPNEDVLLTIVGEDGMSIKRYQHGPPSWTGELPATQDCYIYAVSVGSATSYTLYVQVDPL